MLAQKPEKKQKQEEQKQNCKQNFPQEILNWMKIIFNSALSLGFIWTLLYFLSIRVMPEIGNFQNFLFYSLTIFSATLFIVVILTIIGILPGLVLRSWITDKKSLKQNVVLRFFCKEIKCAIITWIYICFSAALLISFILLVHFKELLNFVFFNNFLFSVAIFLLSVLITLLISFIVIKDVYKLYKTQVSKYKWLLLMSLLVYSISISFLTIVFVLSNKKILETNWEIIYYFIFLFIMGIVNSITATEEVEFKNITKNKFISVLLIFVLFLLFWAGNFILKRSFQLLKLGNYNATLIIDKSYADKINLSNFCNLSGLNKQSYKLNATVLSSIGSEYIIKCKKYIIKIPKEKVSSVMLKEK